MELKPNGQIVCEGELSQKFRSIRNARFQLDSLQANKDGNDEDMQIDGWISIRSVEIVNLDTQEVFQFTPRWVQESVIRGNSFEFEQIEYTNKPIDSKIRPSIPFDLHSSFDLW